MSNKTKRTVTCTTAGPMFVHVKDGRIIRTEPLKFQDDEYKPWEVKVNGKTYHPPQKTPLLQWGLTAKKWMYSENRVGYPQKRVDWDPKGDRHPENRGKSGYVRISWNEALDILAGEINRVRNSYGPSAILTAFSAHPEWGSLHYFFSDHLRFWNILGCTVREITPVSWEGWVAGAAFMYGYYAQQGVIPAPDTLQDTSEDSEMIILWGTDLITHNVYHGIDTPHIFQYWKELGKKIILIDPYYNDTGMAYADKWIPIIPGTDAALAAAIAYVWITEKTYDQAYLDTHAIGFDEEHLPAGAPPGSSFMNYILGISDGIPKTPQWAAEITSVPSRVIYALAREWAAKPTALFAMYSGACRRAYAHEWTRFMVTLQTMQGFGKPGVNLVGGILSLSGPYDNRQVGPPGYADGGMNAVANRFYENPVPQILTELLIEKGISNPPVKWRGGKFFMGYPQAFAEEHEYPMPGQSEVHMIWERGSSNVCTPDYNKNLRVYQNPKIETVVVQAPWFDRDCHFADIILPASTVFEKNDLSEPGRAGVYVPPALINMRCAVYHQKSVEPLGESKSDIEIYTALAERLGIKEQFNEGNSEEDWLKKLYTKSNVPMSYDDLKEKGYYVWPALPDYKPCKQMELFYEDPQNHPLETPSGKIEIFSQTLFNMYGADNPEIPPVPHYIPEWEGRYSHPLLEKYPFQLTTIHPKYRFHGKYNDVTWLRELYKVKGPDGYEYEPIVMHPQDASRKGFKEGDVVRVFNDRGQILCGVVISNRLVPGVVWVAYGSWPDLLEPKPGSLDRGGNSNFLTSSRGMSEHYIGWACNSALVDVEKADLEALATQHPEGWAGKYRTWNKE